MNTSLQELAPLRQELGREGRLFTDRLGASLVAPEAGQSLIFAAARRRHFVQFTSSCESGLRAESVSKAFVAEADQLTSVDRVPLRFCGATDGVEATLQRDFSGLTTFIEILRGALLH